MYTYETLAKYPGKKDSKLIKKSQLQTLARRDGAILSIWLVNTPILTYMPDGRIVLKAEQWQTNTTKARMNDYLPGNWFVYQEKNVWYVAQRGGESFVFADGITLLPDGTVEGDGNAKETQALTKKVNRYVKKFMAALEAGDVPLPSGGDCWYCVMENDNGTLGEQTDAHHILLHIEEDYFVPSLIFRAAEVRGVSDYAKYWLYALVTPEVERPKYFCEISKKQLSNALREYIRQQLSLPV